MIYGGYLRRRANESPRGEGRRRGVREIKFRAWDREGRAWEDGFYLQKNGTVVICGGYPELDYDADEERYVVMQFTGLKDKNGKEIYEGDIIQSDVLGELIVGKVLYADGWASFFLAVTNKYGVGVAMTEADAWYHDEDGETKAEVIGNIYENPELLESRP
jgi:uncharacterized phage protein (TIGR01671 family)